jgi:hypothetical protein
MSEVEKLASEFSAAMYTSTVRDDFVVPGLEGSVGLVVPPGSGQTVGSRGSSSPPQALKARRPNSHMHIFFFMIS